MLATFKTAPTPADSTPSPLAVRIPLGALRVLARDEDRQILIVDGEGRAAAFGERMAHVEWLPSTAVAAEMARHCAQLLKDAGTGADSEGWHPFSVEHLKVLLREARRRLNIEVLLDDPRKPPPRQAWTRERVAMLGFLAGQGWTAKRIATHPLIASTGVNVHKQAQRFGIALSGAQQGRLTMRLPSATMARYDAAARAAGLATPAFARRVLIAAAAESGRLVASI